MRHTKGEWKTRVINDPEFGYEIGLSAKDEDAICCVFKDVKEANANAKLISAAPDLLEALQSIIEIGKRDMSNPKYDGYFEGAKQAIKKATEV